MSASCAARKYEPVVFLKTKKTLKERQDDLVAEINGLGDCFEQFSYLLFRAGNLPEMKASQKTTENRIRGCQSVVWADIRVEDGILYFSADSETLIIKGVLAIFAELLDGTPVEEIRNTPIDILERTELAVTFESERTIGIKSVLRQVGQAAE